MYLIKMTGDGYPSNKQIFEILMGEGQPDEYYEVANIPDDLRIGDWIVGEDGSMVTVFKKVVVPTRTATGPTYAPRDHYSVAYIVKQVGT